MANLEQIVTQKAEKDTRWKEQQQAERENTVALQDAGITQITSSPEAYARYLDMQGDNPAYSVGNIALVMVALPKATVFGTRDRWRALNRSVMGEEMNNSVKILPRAPWAGLCSGRRLRCDADPGPGSETPCSERGQQGHGDRADYGTQLCRGPRSH